MTPTGLDPLVTTIVAFLASIGVPLAWRPLRGPTVLPGLMVDHGVLVIDDAGPRHPGDLLHEAGHLALLPPLVRAGAEDRLGEEWGGAFEAGAICWSVAAASHLGLPLDVVFHPEGYRDGAARLAQTYALGVAPGLPRLVDAGLAWAPGQAPDGEPEFPAMRQWLRTDEVSAR